MLLILAVVQPVHADQGAQTLADAVGLVCAAGAPVCALFQQPNPVTVQWDVTQPKANAWTYLRPDSTLFVNARFQGGPSDDVAALLVHEGTHLLDYAAWGLPRTSWTAALCYQSGTDAYTAQVDFWKWLYPSGNYPRRNAYDVSKMLHLVGLASADGVAHAEQDIGYQAECGGLPG